MEGCDKQLALPDRYLGYAPMLFGTEEGQVRRGCRPGFRRPSQERQVLVEAEKVASFVEHAAAQVDAELCEKHV